MRNIPLSIPNIGGNEWQYVKECLDSGWVSSAGPYVDRFEMDLCDLTGAKYAIACVNGTSALQIALRLAGVENDDEVIVPSLTFIASVNAINYLGAHPLFVDSDEYYNIDTEQVLDFLANGIVQDGTVTRNRETGRRISACLPVHVFGNAANLQAVTETCRSLGIAIVEDAAESLGTVYTKGEYAGRHTGTIGDIGCFSFNGNKIVTTGGGGMIVTNDQRHADRARYLTTQAKDDSIRYVHNEIGYNFRMTNIQAAMGVAQLERLPAFLETKKSNFDRYRTGLAHVDGLTLAEPPNYADNNLWMYALRIDPETYGQDREETMRYLAQQGIQTRPVWYPNHLQKPYRNAQCIGASRAHSLVNRTLNIPCSTNLKAEEIDYVLGHLRNV